LEIAIRKNWQIQIVKMVNNLGTEIRNFFSLVELSEYIEQEISFCKSISEEYGERLGSLLRDNKQAEGDEEWRKSLSGLQKNTQPKKSESKKKGKGKTKRSKSGWINYNQIMLSTEFQGEAHILFEAIENLKSKISRLEKIKDEIEGLKRLGLEENLTYITYLNEGIPEKIVLHKRKDDEQEKFKFITKISLAVQNR